MGRVGEDSDNYKSLYMYIALYNVRKCRTSVNGHLSITDIHVSSVPSIYVVIVTPTAHQLHVSLSGVVISRGELLDAHGATDEGSQVLAGAVGGEGVVDHLRCPPALAVPAQREPHVAGVVEAGVKVLLLRLAHLTGSLGGEWIHSL